MCKISKVVMSDDLDDWETSAVWHTLQFAEESAEHNFCSQGSQRFLFVCLFVLFFLRQQVQGKMPQAGSFKVAGKYCIFVAVADLVETLPEWLPSELLVSCSVMCKS